MNDRISFLCSVIDPVWFTRRYVQIYDATQHRWRPFSLWPVQGSVLARMKAERKLVVLKARQLGISWLSLAYALWLLVCRPPCLACSSGRRRYIVGPGRGQRAQRRVGGVRARRQDMGAGGAAASLGGLRRPAGLAEYSRVQAS
ncbi:MAG: hypothetical protein ACKO9F_11635 [Caldilinea sp.]